MLSFLTPRGRRREIGWCLALCAVVLSVTGLLPGNPRVSAYLAVAAAAGLIICTPPSARRLVPFGLAGLGLLGLVLALSSPAPFANPLLNGSVVGRAASWRASLVLQSVAFLAAGLWMIWCGTDSRSRLARIVLSSRRRWGLLLPPVLVPLILMLDRPYAYPAWVAAATAAAVALIVVILLPAAAADLTAAGLTVLGVTAIAFVVSAPITLLRTRGAGLSGGGMAVSVGFDRPLTLVAAVQGTAILAFGLWLVPRTIGVHAKARLRSEPDAELAGRVERLTQTRADAVDSAAAELRRVERDLHDGAQARLVALGMNLRAVERLMLKSPQAALALVAEARETSSKALTELRDLVRGIYPPVLADRGLGDAVQALALDTPLRTETDIDLPGRLDAPVESACYFAVAEALANAVKHSGARLVQIRIRHRGGMLRIEVTDNGTGGADPARGSGLAGVERRLGTFDGILAMSSPPGGPTMIVMEVPCTLFAATVSSR